MAVRPPDVPNWLGPPPLPQGVPLADPESIPVLPTVAPPKVSSADRPESMLPWIVSCVPLEAGMAVRPPDVPDCLGPPLLPQGMPLADASCSCVP